MVAALEQTQQHQEAADRLYEGITGILHQQMHEHLPCRMNRKGSSQRKPPHSYKPWWTDELTRSWQEVTTAEKAYLAAPPHHRHQLRHIYVASRKTFSKKLQRAKRIHWHKSQAELLNMCTRNSTQFWKRITNLVVRQTVKKHIPMEVQKEDGRTCTDPQTVLDFW